MANPNPSGPLGYSITIPDIRNYLSSLAPTDPAGDTTDSTSCLIAQALMHKYGQKEVHVAYGAFAIDGIRYTVEQEVTGVIWDFDKILVQFPTRAEVEAAIPALKGEN